MTIVSMKEARSSIGRLIDKAQRGEEIIITRRGKKVAILQGVERESKRLPAQRDFRKKIHLKGKPMSHIVSENRSAERF